MTSKKKVLTVLAKLVLFASFLVQVGFFSQFSAPHKEWSSEEKIQLQTLERSIEKLAKENASIEEMQKVSKEYKEVVGSVEKDREAFFYTIKQLGISGVASWLLNIYFYLLPWFALLFLVWLIEGSERKKTFFRNPISFLFSVIIYPIVMLCVITSWARLAGRKVIITAELRQTKEKFFSILSEDELDKIKEFAQSKLSISFWQKILFLEGKKKQHSFAVAITVTVMLMIIGNPLVRVVEANLLVKEVTVTQLVINTSPNVSVGYSNPCLMDMLLANIWIEQRLEKTTRIYINLISRCLDGFIMEIEHIPDSLAVI